MERINIDEILKEVSKETGISEREVKEIYDFFFKKIRYYMQLFTMPQIDIKNFFKFKLDFKKVNKRLLELDLQKKIDNISNEYYNSINDYFNASIKYNNEHRKRPSEKQLRSRFQTRVRRRTNSKSSE